MHSRQIIPASSKVIAGNTAYSFNTEFKSQGGPENEGGTDMDTAIIMKENKHTVEEIYALPEGQRAEIINGKWYDMAAPSTTHQRLVAAIGGEFRNFFKSKGGKCEAFISPFAVFINKDEYNYLEPDVLVVCDPEKIDEKGCHGAPDLVVEIVSPSSRIMDYMKKLVKYQETRVREYWIVDPLTRYTHIYNFDYEGAEDDTDKGTFELRQFGFDEAIVSKLYPEFSPVLAEEPGV
jgi:Uma2 family endonuclease